jgi:AcrR family transcriptional regulator
MSASPRRQRKAEETRSLILEAAARRFSERGFAETRIEDVGEDVGIGRSAVLYHFKDKRLLYRAVLDELFGGLLVELRSALGAAGSLAERLEAAVCAGADFMGRNPNAARLAVRESVNADPEIRAEIQAQARPFLMLLEMIFEEGERSGVFRPLRSDHFHFVSTIAGATLFYVAALPAVVDDLPYDPLSEAPFEAHKRDLVDITRRLLGIRGPRRVAGERNGPTDGRHE